MEGLTDLMNAITNIICRGRFDRSNERKKRSLVSSILYYLLMLALPWCDMAEPLIDNFRMKWWIELDRGLCLSKNVTVDWLMIESSKSSWLWSIIFFWCMSLYTLWNRNMTAILLQTLGKYVLLGNVRYLIVQ